MWFVFIISSETERITGILPQRYKFITHIKSSQRGMGIWKHYLEASPPIALKNAHCCLFLKIS